MISELFTNFISSYKAIIGTGCVLVLFVVAVFLLVNITDSNGEDDFAENRLACKINSKTDGKEGWGIVLLIFSVYGTIAAGISKLCNMQDVKISIWKRMLICVLCVFAIVISGKRIIAPDFLVKSENLMHMPSDLRESMDIILNVAEEDKIGVVTMPGYGDYFRAYNSCFSPLYDDPANNDLERLPDELKATYVELCDIYPDMRIVARTAHKYDCNYIVIMRESYWPEVPLTDLGYILLGSNGRWDVYMEAREGNE